MRYNYYELSSDSLDLCKGKLTPGVTATWGEIAGNIETQKDLVSYISAHGTAAWGSISGSITNQTDLIEYTDRFATISWIESKHLLGQMNGYTSDGQAWWMNFSTSEARISLMKWTSDPSNPGQFLNEVYTFISPNGMLVSNFLPSGSQVYSIAGAIRSTHIDVTATTRVSPTYTGVGMSIDETDGTPYMYISGSSKVTFLDDHLSTGGINIKYSDIASKSDLSQYATRQWVTGRGYITTSALSGYATESWVSSQGYITTSALSSYATQSWVQSQGYMVDDPMNPYVKSTTLDSFETYLMTYEIPNAGYIKFDLSHPLSSIEKTLPFYSSNVGLFPVYQSYSSTWVNIEMMTDEFGYVSMGLVCYDSAGSTVWFDKFQTTNDMTGYVSRSYVDWRVQADGYPLSIYTLADENGNYTIGSLDDTTYAFTGIKVSGSQAGAYTVISSGYQYQESFSPFVTESTLDSVEARLSALETNYGDAITITNNILS